MTRQVRIGYKVLVKGIERPNQFRGDWGEKEVKTTENKYSGPIAAMVNVGIENIAHFVPWQCASNSTVLY